MKSKISKLFEAFENSHAKKQFLTLVDQNVRYDKFSQDLDRLNGSDFFRNLSYQSKLVISTQDDYSKILVFLFALRKGIIPVILDPNTNLKRLQKLLTDLEPDAFVLDNTLVSSWLDQPENSPVLEVKKEQKKKGFFSQKLKKKSNDEIEDNTLQYLLKNGTANPMYPSDIKDEDIAYIMYTSGSTSDPKGVMIRYNGLIDHLETLVKVYELNETSVIFNPLMLEHADGIIQGPILTAFCQGQLVRPVKFEIDKIPEVLTSMYKYRISHFVSVPAMLSLINQFAPEEFNDSFTTDDFKYVISVSSHIELDLWRSIESRFNCRLINVYGLTETVAGSFFCGPDASSRKIGTIGKPVDTEALIVNEEGASCQDHERGELLIKGLHITAGYFKNDSATNKLFTNGWMRTGDIAVRDEDGFYSIVGRKKNIVISGGFNIQPEEIREVLLTYPDIQDCYCLGIPDSTFGERLVAVYTSAKNVLPEDLESFASQNLENEKVPSRFIKVDSLPMGLSGKVNEPALKTQVSLSLESTGVKTQDIDEGIKAAASKAFNKSVADIELHHNSKNLEGWDSLAHLDFIINIESIFDIKLKTNRIITMNSIQTAINVVTDELKS